MCSGRAARLTICTFTAAFVVVSSLATASAQTDSTEACNNGMLNNGMLNCTGNTLYGKNLSRLPSLADTYPLDLIHESFMFELPVDEYVEKLAEVLCSVSPGATEQDGKALLHYMTGTTGGPVYGFGRDFAQRVMNLFVRARDAEEDPDYYAMAQEAITRTPNGFLYNLSEGPNNISNKEAIDLIDDTFEINRLVHMQMVIPTASKSLPEAAETDTQNHFSSQNERANNLAIMRKKSATQPYIDITPKWVPKPGFYLSAYMKALISLRHRMPEGSTLRLFPTTTADGQYLTCEVIIMYPDESGALKYSPVLEIIRDWGTPDSAGWLTDRIAQRNLVAQDLISYRDQPLNHLRGNLSGNPSSLPVFNPIDAEMIQILADLIKEYLQDPDAQCEYCNNFDFRDYPAPRHVKIKQSGYYMAAVDAGDMVFFVDLFASQNTASPRITMKKVPFSRVDPDIMTRLDAHRINRYDSVLSGVNPFDPVNKQLELAFLKLLVSQITTNFGKSGIQKIIGTDAVDFPHPVVQSIYSSMIKQRQPAH